MPVKNGEGQDREDGESQAMIAVDRAAYLYLDQTKSMGFAPCHKADREEAAEHCNLPVSWNEMLSVHTGV
jgi:hypothetical protein